MLPDDNPSVQVSQSQTQVKLPTCTPENENSTLPTQIDIVFRDDLFKCKQNVDVIMDDTFIHLTEDEHMDDLMDLLRYYRNMVLKYHHTNVNFLRKTIVYMGLEFQVKDDKVCYIPL